MKDFILVFLVVFSSIMAHWGVVAMLVVRKIKSSVGFVVPNSLSSVSKYLVPSALLVSLLVSLLSVL